MKEKIAAFAGNMFLKFGFKNVSMDDIANKMCISKKTVYKYFERKENLVKESVDATCAVIQQKFADIIAQHHNAVEENFQVIQVVNDFLQYEHNSPLFQLKKYYPEIYEQGSSQRLEIFEGFHLQNLKKGIEQGLYRPEIDIDSIMFLFYTLMFSLNDYAETKTSQELFFLRLSAMEYHVRAITTEKGVKELEKQLEQLKKGNVK